MRKLLYVLAMLAVLATVGGLTACGASKADVAAHNLSVEAEKFQIPRRIVVINTFTDKYLLVVQGYCSVETAHSALAGSLELTCQVTKNGQDLYYKDYVGLSKFVAYTVEQLNRSDVSTSHFEVLFRPETIIPAFTR